MISACALFALASALAPAATETTVIVLPFAADGASDARTRDIQRLFTEQLRTWRNVTVWSDAQTVQWLEQTVGRKPCGVDENCMNQVLQSARVDAVLSARVTLLNNNERVFARSVWLADRSLTSDAVMPASGDLREPLEDLAERVFKPALVGAYIQLECQVPGIDVVMPDNQPVSCPVSRMFGPYRVHPDPSILLLVAGVPKGSWRVVLRRTQVSTVRVDSKGGEVVIEQDNEVREVPNAPPAMLPGSEPPPAPATTARDDGKSSGPKPLVFAGIGVLGAGAVLAAVGVLSTLLGAVLVIAMPKANGGFALLPGEPLVVGASRAGASIGAIPVGLVVGLLALAALVGGAALVAVGLVTGSKE